METPNIIPQQAQGALRPGRVIVWLRDDDTPENLTNATITGVLRSRTTGAPRAIAGEFIIVDGAAGTFAWTFDAQDVAEADYYDVQFSASFPSSSETPAKTFTALWQVSESLSVPN